MADHNQLGKKGEILAENYLQEKGYKILERNWRYSRIEIDIIAEINNFIVFIEVKTRSSQQWGNPEEAVNSAKINNIIEAANHYIEKNDVEQPVRFDVVSVTCINNKIDIVHFDDAFFAPLS